MSKPIAILVVPNAGTTGRVVQAFPATKEGQRRADAFCDTLSSDWSQHYLYPGSELVDGYKLLLS